MGPYYPVDPDPGAGSDLATVNGQDLAKGEIILVSGRVRSTEGAVLAGVLVEIWQCNAFGRYHHPRDTSSGPLDPNFRAYGRFTTGADGVYRFRTIKPVPYTGRTPHIHFRLSRGGSELLVTQMYLEGHPQNDRDFLLRRVGDDADRRLLMARIEQVAGSRWPEAAFDIVLAR